MVRASKRALPGELAPGAVEYAVARFFGHYDLGGAAQQGSTTDIYYSRYVNFVDAHSGVLDIETSPLGVFPKGALLLDGSHP